MLMLMYWVKNISTINKDRSLLQGSREVGPEMNTEKIKYMVVFHH